MAPTLGGGGVPPGASGSSHPPPLAPYPLIQPSISPSRPVDSSACCLQELYALAGS